MRAPMLVLSLVLALAAGGNAADFVTDAGTYSTVSAADLSAYLAIAPAVSEIKGLLGVAGDVDYAAIKTSYETSIQGLATTDYGSAASYVAYTTHYGASTWMDTYMSAAIDGTSSSDAGARAEMIEKTAMDAVPVNSILALIRTGEDADWDAAAALYTGGGGDNSAYTPYARANKRGANYNTNREGTSISECNYSVLAAFSAGASTANADIIQACIYNTYAQASVRYTYLLDVDRVDELPYHEHQGEGWAFWRVIEPFVAAVDSEIATALTTLYTITGLQPTPLVPTSYCAALEIVDALDIAAADFGAYEAAGGVYCTDAGAYVASDAANGAAYVGLAASVVTIKSLLAAATIDFDAIKTEYEANVKPIATESFSGAPTYDTSKDYFGSADWLDTYIMAAIDGTYTTDSSARAEMIEKTAMDAVAVNALLALAYEGRSDAAKWDAAAALYTGGGANSGSAPYGRANKRGLNFGTYRADETADANVAAMAAFSAGGSDANYEAVKAAVMTTYGQASTRYAFKLDNDRKDDLPFLEHQGEGWAFWRVVEPFVAAVDAELASTVTTLYTVTGVQPTQVGTSSYCAVVEIQGALALTDTQFGTLEGTEAVYCTAAGAYTASDAANGVEYLQIAASVATIKSLLGESTIDFSAIQSEFNANIRWLAVTDFSGAPTYDTAKSYFGTGQWLVNYFNEAISGASTSNQDARAEMVEKTAMDAVAVNALLALAYEGRSDAASWDAAAALYTGGGANSGNAPYGRANKRGLNFGTYRADETADANVAAMAAFSAGGSDANYEAVKAAVMTTYGQASTRYAFKLDVDRAGALPFLEHQGEGWAFWRVVEPFVADADSSLAASITDLYTVTGTEPDQLDPTSYCFVSAGIPAALELSTVQFGTLEGTSDVDCDGDGEGDGDDDSAAVSPAAVLAALVAVVAAMAA